LDLDLPSLRFGRVSAASGGPVAITLNKAVAPAVEHKLRPVMRAAGRPHFTINADPALEDEADGPDEVDLDGAAGDGAGGDGGGGVAPGPAGGGAVPADGGTGPEPFGGGSGAAMGAPGLPVAAAGGDGAAAPAGPGPGRAAAPAADLASAPDLPAAAPAVPPAAAAVRARLTPLVQRAAAAVQAGQPGAAALRVAVGQARKALGSGDLAAAGGAADGLERLLGGAGGPASASAPDEVGADSPAPGTLVSAASAAAASLPAVPPPPGGAGPGRGAAAPPSLVVALRDVARGIPAVVAADPSRRQPLARLLADARASADAGDTAAASGKTEALRQALAAPGTAGGGAAGPDGTTDVDGLVTPVAEREPALGRAALTEAPSGAAPGSGTQAAPPSPAVAAGGGLALAGGVAAAPAAPGLLGPVGSAAARRAAAAVFAAAPEVALVVGAVVLAVWIAKHGKVRTVSVAGYDAGARGVAPISAEVNGVRGTAMLYHGLPRDTPDLQSQHSVMLRVGQDGVLTDGSGKAVARLGEGVVVPLPGVDVPGLFHGDVATLPRSEQPPGDEVQDGAVGGLAVPGGAVPGQVGQGPAAMSGLPPGLEDLGTGPGLVPPPPVGPLPGFEADPDAGRPTVLGGSPVPEHLRPPIHTGSPPPAVNLGDLQEAFPALAPQGPTILESRDSSGLTRPSGPLGGVPSGPRSTTARNAPPDRKAQRDSENHVGDALARQGYRTVQNPTEGANPPLTPERMVAEGLGAKKDPDLLIEDRIFDTYTPEKDDAASVRNGIARKIEDKQTHRVVVDLRNTTQTEASVRAALRADPVEGLREVIIVTEEGVGQPFRPLARPMTIPEE